MIRLAVVLLAAAGVLAAEATFEVDGHPAWGALDPVMGDGLTPAAGDVAWIAGLPLVVQAGESHRLKGDGVMIGLTYWSRWRGGAVPQRLVEARLGPEHIEDGSLAAVVAAIDPERTVVRLELSGDRTAGLVSALPADLGYLWLSLPESDGVVRVPGLERLQRLRWLGLGGSAVRFPAASLQPLTELRVVRVAGIELLDPAPLARLPHLRSLQVLWPSAEVEAALVASGLWPRLRTDHDWPQGWRLAASRATSLVCCPTRTSSGGGPSPQVVIDDPALVAVFMGLGEGMNPHDGACLCDGDLEVVVMEGARALGSARIHHLQDLVWQGLGGSGRGALAAGARLRLRTWLVDAGLAAAHPWIARQLTYAAAAEAEERRLRAYYAALLDAALLDRLWGERDREAAAASLAAALPTAPEARLRVWIRLRYHPRDRALTDPLLPAIEACAPAGDAAARAASLAGLVAADPAAGEELAAFCACAEAGEEIPAPVLLQGVRLALARPQLRHPALLRLARAGVAGAAAIWLEVLALPPGTPMPAQPRVPADHPWPPTCGQASERALAQLALVRLGAALPYPEMEERALAATGADGDLYAEILRLLARER